MVPSPDLRGTPKHMFSWRLHSDEMKSNPCVMSTSEVEENERDGDVAMTSKDEGEEK